MNTRASEIVVVGGGVSYLLFLGWSVEHLSYDIWGALIVIPIYLLIGFAVLPRMFAGSLRPLATVFYWGLLIKFGGAAARYWVGFEAYEGAIDAGRYHAYALNRVGDFWAGRIDAVALIPSGIGTSFLERLTSLIYAFTGGSQLAGFMTFAFMAFWGATFMVKAAAIAVPRLAARRYAWFIVLFPSLVYWPSSIGKEAPMMLGLGAASYGVAQLYTSRRSLSGLLAVTLGLGLAALIRPHIVALWMAGMLISLVIGVIGRRSVHTPDARGRLGMFLLLAPALAAFLVTASLTIRYLEPNRGDEAPTESITQIFDETTRRTLQAGSNFNPPSVSSPIGWPYATVRTLARPLPFEARGIAQLFTAAEVSALLALYALSWRRLLSLPMQLISNPYVAYVVSVIALSGLAYSSFANLGVLARQKSLIMPLLLMLPCLPMAQRTAGRRPKAMLASPHGFNPETEPRDEAQTSVSQTGVW